MQQLPPPPKQSTLGSTALGWARGHKLLSGLAAFVLVGALVSGLAGPTDAEPPSNPAETKSVSPMASPEPSVASEPETPTTRVPRVDGLQLQRARDRIVGKNLDVSVVKKFSQEAAGTVLSQSVTAGDQVDEGTTITLIVAKAFPRVPAVAGANGKTAKNRLSNAGFNVVIRTQESSSVSAGTVISSIPAAGAEVRPGAKITLIVAKAPPPPPPPAPSTSGCHPSYQGACLDPNASDYDCAGGSGDGPKYTGYVTVVGYDEYGLDADGDGAGCES